MAKQLGRITHDVDRSRRPVGRSAVVRNSATEEMQTKEIKLDKEIKACAARYIVFPRGHLAAGRRGRCTQGPAVAGNGSIN